MSSFLFRVGRFAARRRLTVIVAWLLLVVGAGVLAGALGNHLLSTFSVPGTQSQQALDELEQRFPQVSGASVKVVVGAPSGDDISSSQSDIVTACQALTSVDDEVAVSCPYAMPATGSTAASDGVSSQIASDNTMVYITVQLSTTAADISDETASQIEAAGQPLTDAGLQVAYSGLPAEAGGTDYTELIGMAVAYIVLAITFGALIAAGIPLITAALGVGLSTSAITIVAAMAPVSATAPVLATMLGLAVGIDYALLITSRHRDNLREGMPVAESVAVATATSGTAVVFAGMTVMIALVGLGVAGIPFLTVMGLGAAGSVLTALLVAVTLLPAVLSLLGNTLRPKARKNAKKPSKTAQPPRWVRGVARHPIVVSIGVVAVLGTLALPAAGIRLTLPDAGYDAPGTQARTAYDMLSDGFGPGFNGPLLITADLSQTLEIEKALTALDSGFTGIPDIAETSQAYPNEGLDMAILTITPSSAPSSDATAQLVQTLRERAPAFAEAHGFTYEVTGQTALAIDISDRLGAAMLPFAFVVVGLSLLLLMIMFRSVAVPVTATLGYLLTVGAALGVATVIFEWGWGADLLGVGKVGPVISFMPILVMAVLFGLAMDYHVFLVSRMRERFVDSGDARGAVLTGFGASARVVTAAALIMFSVFFSFVPGGSATIQPIAFALAIGVLIDAFVVRMTLIPAFMTLLGDKAWWLPPALQRRLPDADIEGEAVRHMLAQRTWRDDAEGRARGAHADEATFGGSAPVAFSVLPGEILLVDGTHAASVCAGVTGRLPDVGGDVSVNGLLIPFERAVLAERAAFVPAIPDPADATTVVEHVRSTLRLDGAADLRDATGRAVGLWDDLRDRTGGLDEPDHAMATLDEQQRWTLDVAAAFASTAEIIALDVRLRHDQEALVGRIVRAAPQRVTLVIAADVPASAVRAQTGAGVRELHAVDSGASARQEVRA